jgi:hypothetical protein
MSRTTQARADNRNSRPAGRRQHPAGTRQRLGNPPDWDWDEEEDFPPPKVLRAEAEDRYVRIHVETAMALKIALATSEFRPDRYTRTNAWGNDWKRQQS